MTLHSFVMGFLMLLPAAVAGFVCGMLYMRGSYMKMLRWLKTMVARQQREINRMRNWN